ncbi:MAG: hypothetical protein CL477_00665 [Acidobacteria bacterium]|jgi:hypothetical protein|nr:hypothetical protein [Acidobacteriota bacterium]|tara:strand:+ start:990 stop:2096 length:1107 start_codon:yes stop_codon:yes gene_type:complete
MDMTRTHAIVLGVALVLTSATSAAQPPDMSEAPVGPVRVETLELQPTVLKTGDLLIQPYRVRFPDLISEGQEIIILEDRMAPETLPVHPFEGVSLTIERSRVEDEHIWTFTYGFRLVDPSKMTYLLPNFSFYYLVRDLGEDIEDAEVQQVDGGQGLVRYVSTITDEPVLAIRDTIELGAFSGRATFFRTLAWTVAPLPLFVWLVMLVRSARKPKAISLEKAQEAEELARLEAQIPVPPSIWDARRALNRQLSALQDVSPSADAPILTEVERGLVLSLRDYLHAELPDLHPGDTVLDMQRHAEALADGPRKEALRTLTGRLVAYQYGLEHDEPAPIESPGEEARSMEEALKLLRPHVRLLNSLKALVGR